MKSNYKDKFIEVFKRVIGTNDVDENWAMNDIAEWDSLKHVQLISELEEELGIELEYDDILSMTSIEKIDVILCKY